MNRALNRKNSEHTLRVLFLREHCLCQEVQEELSAFKNITTNDLSTRKNCYKLIEVENKLLKK